jgi:hypothetical protein
MESGNSMTQWQIAEDGRSFIVDGDDAFMVADTVWSAFADAHESEWRHYVRQRAMQGFTHLLISVLPVGHDRSLRADAREPFELDEQGRYRYDSPNDAYLVRAREMVAIAKDEGLHCALVLLWCCYVEGTWAAELVPWSPIPAAERRVYLESAVDAFADLDPVFIISGDDPYSLESANATYQEALHLVARRAPNAITTMHSRPDAVMPATLADDPALSFYGYQAGHDDASQEKTWELAEQYLGCAVRRPIVDLEPCYEGHGYHGRGRWLRHEVRRASWWSILGGGSAGIGYGAHGLWQWHRPGARFTNSRWSMDPFPWEAALGFPAADDVALASRIVVDNGLVGAEPAQQVLVDAAQGVRAARGRSGVLAVYLPASREITLDVELARGTLWDLAERRPLSAVLRPVGSHTVLDQPDVYGDVLLVAEPS